MIALFHLLSGSFILIAFIIVLLRVTGDVKLSWPYTLGIRALGGGMAYILLSVFAQMSSSV